MTVLAIFGPTASGKTAVAEAIADRIPAELVSADSMQVYRGLPILTAQPERPTQLVAVWELDHEASVVEYQTLAHRAVDEALEQGRTPIVVGGTGLYLRAAISDLSPPPPGDRERWERLYDRLGPERAHAVLAERDPLAAERVHPNDRRRVVRALELAEIGESLQPSRDTLWSGETRHPTLVFGLEVPREELERRIIERTQAMFDAGVEDEVRRALAARCLAHCAPRARPRRDRAAAQRRGDRRGSLAYPPVRRLPAEVDAEDAGSDQGRGGEARGRGRG